MTLRNCIFVIGALCFPAAAFAAEGAPPPIVTAPHFDELKKLLAGNWEGTKTMGNDPSTGRGRSTCWTPKTAAINRLIARKLAGYADRMVFLNGIMIHANKKAELRNAFGSSAILVRNDPAVLRQPGRPHPKDP